MQRKIGEMGSTPIIRIGIIYIAIGIYDELWNDFYPTCECYFCHNAQKGYEVFTDSPRLQNMELERVTWHTVADRGFILNVSAKSEFICSIASDLEKKYDYLFYMNGNYKFIAPIYLTEVLPDEKHKYFTALSFDMYKDRLPSQLPYDRNPKCQAYIEEGKGGKYYQGGFYGGRTKEVLSFSQWCVKRIQEDLNHKIIAKWHDESYLNRYLLNCHPRILNDKYGYTTAFGYKGEYKAVLSNKSTLLGPRFKEFKDLSIDNSVAFLLDERLQVRKIGIIHLNGRLGNQLFQYTYYLYLRKKLGQQIDFYIDSNNYNQLFKAFPSLESCLLPNELRVAINHANSSQRKLFIEEDISYFHEAENPQTAITEYIGYWQCTGYAEEVKEELQKTLAFDDECLNGYNHEVLQQIRSVCSVSVHVRRGDYLSPMFKEVYGKVCTKAYYQKAIRRMKEEVDQKPFFFFFTDDVEWVKKHFKYKNCLVVEGNQGKDDWKDLQLMAACRHHILANSCFSWWGARLGFGKDNRVIVPQWWCYGLPTPNLLPPAWIRISLDKILTQNDFLSAYLILGEMRSSEQMSCWNNLKQSVYAFYLSRNTRKKIFVEIAEKKLDKAVAMLPYVHSGKELVQVTQGLVYLHSQNYISGKADDIFAETDALLRKRLTLIDKQLEIRLADVAGYFLSRILSPGKRSKQTLRMLEQTLEEVLQQLWTNRKKIPEEDRKKIIIILRRIKEKQVLQSDWNTLYISCLMECDISSLFLAGKEIK